MSQICDANLLQNAGLLEPCIDWQNTQKLKYDCSLPGMEDLGLSAGQYEGVVANYLSFNTDTSTNHYRFRAEEIQNCTGGKILFSESNQIFRDPISDLGTAKSKGAELYDGYLMIYSFTAEASELGLLETLNDRIRDKNEFLQYEDMLPKVKAMGEYRKNGSTNIDVLMADGDFLVPVIRLDLLEKFNKPLPETWEDVVELAKFFNGTDLNDDGIADDYGFCYYPGEDFGFNDEWWGELLYSTWATTDQTRGIQEGFFFDDETFEPRIGPGLEHAAEIWKELYANGGNGCTSSNFKDGRCAIGYAPPGCWKGIFVGSNSADDGVRRLDENGTVVWQPKMANGDYAEPYRFRPPGSLNVVDRKTNKFVECSAVSCPQAEKIPSEYNDRADILPASPHVGRYINRSPFFWAGGYGTAIRASADPIKKDLMFDFFAYVNGPITSVPDVVRPSWLDSWRWKQLEPTKRDPPINYFLDNGWSQDAFDEHKKVMLWALGDGANSAFNLRIPGVYQYTFEYVGKQFSKFVRDAISLDDFMANVLQGWQEVTLGKGKLTQLEIYRSSLGKDPLPEFNLCELHRDQMDERDPAVCKKYDPVVEADEQDLLWVYILVPVLVVVLIAASVWIYIERKRRSADSVWQIDLNELIFAVPPDIAGRGTFGLVVMAEYRGTVVAVKRVIPPKEIVATMETMKIVPRRTSGNTNTKPTHVSFQAEIPLGGPEESLEEAGEREGFPTSNIFVANRNNSMQHSVMSLDPMDSAGVVKRKTSMQHSVLSSVDATGMSSSRTSSFGFNSIKGWRRGLCGSKHKQKYEQLKQDFMAEMRTLSKLRHPCITTVMGSVIESGEEPMLVMEYMEHGSLYDLLHNETIAMDGDLIFPILQDIARGARFLHAATPEIVHGDLKAANVLVDGRFRAKISDFGLSAKKKYIGASGTPYWMAPELLSGESTNTIESDVYAFGIILYELYSRKDPYDGEDPSRVLKEIVDPQINKRPPVPVGTPSKVADILTECLDADHEKRPTFEEIDHRIKRLNSEIVEPENITFGHRAQKDADKNQELLDQVFPKHIAKALRDGRKVEPDRAEMATMFFSDIVGFTTISAILTPDQVSDLLDRLYLKFDALSEKHNVFKIETIGDAYVGVTNLVEEQDLDHAKRIAEFAIDTVQAAAETPILVDDPSMGCVKIRVGMHSGPLIARVVGSRNPRYCVFGDTVNTAARMESNSIEGRIQCSDRCARLLQMQCPEISLTARGMIKIKGKGEMETFFVSHRVTMQ